jgi:hypothetical protein
LALAWAGDAAFEIAVKLPIPPHVRRQAVALGASRLSASSRDHYHHGVPNAVPKDYSAVQNYQAGRLTAHAECARLISVNKTWSRPR